AVPDGFHGQYGPCHCIAPWFEAGVPASIRTNAGCRPGRSRASAPEAGIDGADTKTGPPKRACSVCRSGVPTGIRTPVSTVKGWCPRPLDDGDAVGTLVGNGRAGSGKVVEPGGIEP